MISCIFVGRSTGQRGLREERKNWLQTGCEFWECLAASFTQNTAPRLCWTVFLQEKKSGLFWDKGLSVTTCHTSIHFCYPTEKSKVLLYLYVNLLEFLQKLNTLFCTPSWRLSACTLVQHTNRKPTMQYLLPRYKDRNTPSTVIVFTLRTRCSNTNKPFTAGKSSPRHSNDSGRTSSRWQEGGGLKVGTGSTKLLFAEG